MILRTKSNCRIKEKLKDSAYSSLEQHAFLVHFLVLLEIELDLVAEHLVVQVLGEVDFGQRFHSLQDRVLSLLRHQALLETAQIVDQLLQVAVVVDLSALLTIAVNLRIALIAHLIADLVQVSVFADRVRLELHLVNVGQTCLTTTSAVVVQRITLPLLARRLRVLLQVLLILLLDGRQFASLRILSHSGRVRFVALRTVSLAFDFIFDSLDLVSSVRAWLRML